MGESRQELLSKVWLGGRQGNLSPMMEAKAWALREIWNDEKESSYGMLEYIAGKVVKVGPEGGKPEQPTDPGFDEFLEAIVATGYDRRISVEDNGKRFSDFDAEAGPALAYLKDRLDGGS